METISKVSIGGISFTIEDKAYKIVHSYIDTLTDHYKGSPNGAEIIEGIESRIAELFIDRGGKNGIVTEAMAREVLGIVGKPEDIFGDSDTGGSRHNGSPRRKLYRNPDDIKIAGVCSGVAAYFKVDTFWIRIAMAAVLVLSAVTARGNWWNPALPLVLYCILWIAMPLARTTAQKCEMNGESLSYDNIERQVENRKEYESTHSRSGEFLPTFFKICLIIIGTILAIIGLSGIIAMVGLLFGFAVAGVAIPAVVTGLFAAATGLPAWMAVTIKVLAALVVFLPFIGMLYGGIDMIFNFKAPKWKPGLIIFLLWIASIVGLAAFAGSASSRFWKIDSAKAEMPIETVTDTLFVEFDDLKQWEDSKVYLKGDKHEFKLAYLDLTDRKQPVAAVYPEIEISHRDGRASVNMSSCFFPKSLSLNEFNSASTPDFCHMSGDTLHVAPTVFGHGHAFKEAEMKVQIKVPDNVKVVISEPVRHHFDSEISFTDLDINFLKKKIK